MILTSYQRLNTTGNLHFRLGGHYNSVFARDILKEVTDFFEFNQNFLRMWSLTNSQKHQKWVNPYSIVFILTNFTFFTYGHVTLNTHDCSKKVPKIILPLLSASEILSWTNFLSQVGGWPPPRGINPSNCVCHYYLGSQQILDIYLSRVWSVPRDVQKFAFLENNMIFVKLDQFSTLFRDILGRP